MGFVSLQSWKGLLQPQPQRRLYLGRHLAMLVEWVGLVIEWVLPNKNLSLVEDLDRAQMEWGLLGWTTESTLR